MKFILLPRFHLRQMPVAESGSSRGISKCQCLIEECVCNGASSGRSSTIITGMSINLNSSLTSACQVVPTIPPPWIPFMDLGPKKVGEWFHVLRLNILQIRSAPIIMAYLLAPNGEVWKQPSDSKPSDIKKNSTLHRYFPYTNVDINKETLISKNNNFVQN